eukprot:TRINITY_DN19742_c0_g1_i3.p1 TRINITY_DN19742_c0_g1~~TRINITY_DN19742_c0_g1_i3.p1  ORF type:complete len:130 (+),score=16.23 TRINITY_DN19742_c0_g1_i3:38-427(+)
MVAQDEIRCSCGVTEDDGLMMIACEICDVWMHCHCIGLRDNDMPDHFICEDCQPDAVNVENVVCRCPGQLRQGMLVQCVGCQCWSHTVCMKINKKESKQYSCAGCASGNKRAGLESPRSEKKTKASKRR